LNPGRSRIFALLQNPIDLLWSPTNFLIKWIRGFYLPAKQPRIDAPQLGMSGAIINLSLYASSACAGKSLHYRKTNDKRMA
jgi:hypothetical protein